MKRGRFESKESVADASTLRREFLVYFRTRPVYKNLDHREEMPAPLVLRDDPSLLFTNAGMAQYKPYYLGVKAPPFPRLVTCQPCLRTTDVEKVGTTPRHLTFFEMLGNFSFGSKSYFKAQAIFMALEFLTEFLKMDPNRLWVTVFQGDEEVPADEESRDFWREAGIPADRILARGKEDNFWKMGETGPCGPCTEIYYRLTEKALPGDEEKSLEIWNLVFMEYNRRGEGKLERLPERGVDTGMGLERLCAVVNGYTSVFETHLLAPLVQHYLNLFEKKDPKERVKVAQICADHLRAVCFTMAENIRPSNVKHGYVVRRLIRRAVRYGVKMGMSRPFFHTGVNTLVGKSTDMDMTYLPNFRERSYLIWKAIEAEETAFFRTLEVGTRYFEEKISGLREDTLPGEVAFALYDTYGFPLELTIEMAREQGLKVDEEGYQREMERQRERGRRAHRVASEEWAAAGEPRASQFVGYQRLESPAHIQYIRRKNDEIIVALDVTPFYAEAGGQMGDTGEIKSLLTDARIEVLDTRHEMGTILHYGRILNGDVRVGEEVEAKVDGQRRAAIRRAHTATHLLHSALRNLLGEGATQAGSLVGPDLLRFDVHALHPISQEQLEELEQKVNEWIFQNHPVKAEEKSYEEAMASGAVALFGEKYGSTVRVVEVEGISRELCGGTHLDRTHEVGFFKITGEEGVGAGLRRLEAVTGLEALRWVQHSDRILRALSRHLSTPIISLEKKFLEHQRLLEGLRKQVQRWKARTLVESLDHLEKIGNAVGYKELEDVTPKELADVAGLFIRRNPDKAVVLGCVHEKKAYVVVAIGPNLMKEGVSARTIIHEVRDIIQGEGGGQDHFAQAGGKKVDSLSLAIQNAADSLFLQLLGPSPYGGR